MLSSEFIDKKTDEELIPLIFESQDYFAYLVRRYEEKLMRYIVRISGLTKEDAEDLLQDVFIKVYQNLNDFDTNLKFSSWVYRITHNEVISNHRKLKARPKSVSYDDDPVLINKLASSENFIKEIDKKFNATTIQKVLAKMDNKYKEVLILRFFEEKDYNEMSDILQRPIGTVGAMVNRGKKQFKEIIIREKINF